MVLSRKLYVKRKCEGARAVFKKIDFPNSHTGICVRVYHMSAIVSKWFLATDGYLMLNVFSAQNCLTTNMRDTNLAIWGLRHHFHEVIRPWQAFVQIVQICSLSLYDLYLYQGPIITIFQLECDCVCVQQCNNLCYMMNSALLRSLWPILTYCYTSKYLSVWLPSPQAILIIRIFQKRVKIIFFFINFDVMWWVTLDMRTEAHTQFDVSQLRYNHFMVLKMALSLLIKTFSGLHNTGVRLRMHFRIWLLAVSAQ